MAFSCFYIYVYNVLDEEGIAVPAENYTGISQFFNLQLSCWSDFNSQTTKPDIMHHSSIETGRNSLLTETGPVLK